MSRNFAKCYDNGCPERETCLRWIHRNEENMSSRFSMFPYDLDIGCKCPNIIKKEGSKRIKITTEEFQTDPEKYVENCSRKKITYEIEHEGKMFLLIPYDEYADLINEMDAK